MKDLYFDPLIMQHLKATQDNLIFLLSSIDIKFVIKITKSVLNSVTKREITSIGTIGQ